MGSAACVKHTLALAASQDEQQRQRTSRRLKAVTVTVIIAATTKQREVDPSECIGIRSMTAGREQTTLQCRHWTAEALSFWSAQFGRAHPDLSSNLVRHTTNRFSESQAYRNTIATLGRTFGLKSENQGCLQSSFSQKRNHYNGSVSVIEAVHVHIYSITIQQLSHLE